MDILYWHYVVECYSRFSFSDLLIKPSFYWIRPVILQPSTQKNTGGL